jgi:hypothetical protein
MHVHAAKNRAFTPRWSSGWLKNVASWIVTTLAISRCGDVASGIV